MRMHVFSNKIRKSHICRRVTQTLLSTVFKMSLNIYHSSLHYTESTSERVGTSSNKVIGRGRCKGSTIYVSLVIDRM